MQHIVLVFSPPVSQCRDVWTYELTLLWEFVLWVTRQRCTMVPALSSRGQSSAFGKSHLNTFSLVPELNLLHRQHDKHTPPITKYHLVHLVRSGPMKTCTLNRNVYQSRVKLAGPCGRPRLWFCRPSSSSSRMDIEPEWAK